MIKARAAVIIIRRGKILLASHDKGNGREYWVIPGGTVEKGETLEKAAIREMKEETGLDVCIEKLVFVSDFIPEGSGRHTIDFFFKGRAVSGALRKGADRFLSGLKYFPPDRLDKLVFYPYITEELKEAIQNNFCRPAVYLGNRRSDESVPVRKNKK